MSPTERSKLLLEIKRILISRRYKEAEARFKILYKAATEVIGCGLLTSNRQRELVIGRMLIAYQMRSEGFTYQTIGMFLKRAYASVYNLNAKMQDAIKHPYIFKEEMEQWQRFQKLIKEYEKEV